MNLENPKKFQMLADQAHQVAKNVYRPISRKYDKAEHADLHGLLTAEHKGQVRFSVKTQTRLSAAGGSPIQHPHRFKLNSKI